MSSGTPAKGREYVLRGLPAPSGPRWLSVKLLCGMLCFVFLFFGCVWLWPNSSQHMVNHAVNLVLLCVCGGCALAALVLLLLKKPANRSVSGGLLAAALCTAGGALFIEYAFAQTAAGYFVYVLAVAAGIFLWMLLRGSLSVPKAAFWMVALACALRFGFAMMMSAVEHQHDVDFADSFADSYGHAQYIGILLSGSLPVQNGDWQLHQPPLYYALAALFWQFNSIFVDWSHHIVENLQLLSMLFSCLFLVLWYRMLILLRLDGAGMLAALALVAFHPAFFFLGGAINNDMLLWLLVLAALMYLIKWMRYGRKGSAAFAGLFTGLAMMTKTSAVLLLPLALGTGIYLLVKNTGKKRIAGGFGLYALVSAVLGLWYPVRNFLMFGQPLFFIPVSGSTEQYLGNIPLLYRLLPIASSLWRTPYVQWPNGDYNTLLKTVKTSLFSEHFTGYGIPGLVLSWAMLVLQLALVVLAVVSAVYLLVKLRRSKERPVYCMLVFAVLGLSAIYTVFTLLYPWQYNLDIRFVAILIPLGAVLTGRAAMLAGQRGGRIYTLVAAGLTGLFSLGYVTQLVWHSFHHVF